MKVLLPAALATVMALAVPALALQVQTSGATASAPGAARVSQTSRVTALVVAIAPETRTVTLKQPNGRTHDVHVGDDVKNFDQIKVGDKVTVEYVQELTLALGKEGQGPTESSQRESITRAPEGAKPGGTVGREVTVLAKVESVNSKDQVVTLRGPQGNLVDLKVQDPEQLKRVKKGDNVRVVYTEALAITVAPAAASSGK